LSVADGRRRPGSGDRLDAGVDVVQWLPPASFIYVLHPNRIERMAL
jgi:hypothetical protein